MERPLCGRNNPVLIKINMLDEDDDKPTIVKESAWFYFDFVIEIKGEGRYPSNDIIFTFCLKSRYLVQIYYQANLE